MLQNSHLRYLLGIVLGACAGLSFNLSVWPVALQMGNIGSQLELTRTVASLWPWSALLWAAGGLSAVRAGSPLPAALALGIVGVVSGALLTAFGPGLAPGPLAFGTLAGGVYGGLGGLIIGRVTAPAPTGESS